jgi:lysyl-tRNA synthetase class 1
VLTGAADICNGNRTQIARIVRDHLDGECPAADEDLLRELEPRLSCALGWVEHCLEEDERVSVRAEFAVELWATLSEEEHRSVGMLLDGIEDNWGLTPLTSHVYGVPKRMAGLPLDVKPTPELKLAQRAFFRLLYTLLLDDETGPRLPTLLLSLGLERVRSLLQPAH